MSDSPSGRGVADVTPSDGVCLLSLAANHQRPSFRSFRVVLHDRDSCRFGRFEGDLPDKLEHATCLSGIHMIHRVWVGCTRPGSHCALSAVRFASGFDQFPRVSRRQNLPNGGTVVPDSKATMGPSHIFRSFAVVCLPRIWYLCLLGTLVWKRGRPYVVRG